MTVKQVHRLIQQDYVIVLSYLQGVDVFACIILPNSHAQCYVYLGILDNGQKYGICSKTSLCWHLQRLKI